MPKFRGYGLLAVVARNALPALTGLLPGADLLKVRQPLFWCALLLGTFFFYNGGLAHASTPVHIGYYQNPPKVFQDEQGQPAGFWPELTQTIAAEHDLELEWHFGEWEALLVALERGDLDMLVDVAVTGERRERLLFGTETTLVSWSQVFAAPGREFRRVADLAGQRVGILDSSVNVAGPEGLKMLLREYEVEAQLVSYPSYQAIFRALSSGELDAGVTNRDFGQHYGAELGMEGTPILFQPVELRYAFSPSSERATALREAFDQSLKELKATPDSEFYQQIAYWIAAGAPERRNLLPGWVFWSLGILLALAALLSVMVLTIETRVRTRTRQLRAHERELEASRDSLWQELDIRSALINSLPAQIAILDQHGYITAVNQRWQDFTQQFEPADEQTLPGVSYVETCQNRDSQSPLVQTGLTHSLTDILAGRRNHYEADYPWHSDKGECWYRVMVNPIRLRDKGHHGVVVMHLDITEQKKAEMHLNRLAYEDPLTGLNSRNGFVQAVERQHQTNGWEARGLVVAMDVLGLRDINDAFGYAAGDELLQELARRLEQFSGTRGVCSRTGGDEFIMYLPDRVQDARGTIQALHEQLSQPYWVGGIAVTMLVRQGYTRLGQQPRAVEILMREAELALSENRQDLRQPWTAYSQKLYRQDKQRIEFTQELRRALDEKQFELFFQPQIDLQQGTVSGLEALVRWHHPTRGLQSPAVFVPLAEKSRLIVPLGDWVLRAACEQLKTWRAAGYKPLPLSVNVSVMQFLSGDLPDKVARLLSEYELPPSAITLEVTESVFEHESEQLREQLRSLQQLGVGLALDDFGTGYSSLAYLQKYPFDAIKIDRAFVGAMLDDVYSRNIVETIVALAGLLGEKVVAEGIESQEIEQLLVSLGCEYGQGFLYSEPLPEPALRQWLASQ